MILALDTSSAISVALLDGDRVVAAASEYAPRSHAELLAPMVKSVLSAGGAPEIERVVVGTGPAPFTGLRVGLVTARTLAFAWSVPVVGVCSLDAIGAAHGGPVTVVADARRKEVYWATYRDAVRIAGPFVDAPGEVPTGAAVVGRGATLYPDDFPCAGRAPEGFLDPDPAWLVRVVTRLEAAGVTDFPTVPLYLRRPDVHGLPGGGTAYNLRDATPDDLDWIAEQEVAIFGSGAWSRESIAADLSASDRRRIWLRRYVVAEADGERVGYAVFGSESDVFSLLNLAVVPEARRRGVGAFLLDRFFDDARTLRVREVGLEVAVDNAPALALYRSHGFEEVRVRRRYYQPGDIDAVVMRRLL